VLPALAKSYEEEQQDTPLEAPADRPARGRPEGIVNENELRSISRARRFAFALRLRGCVQEPAATSLFYHTNPHA
jgi:hypothetical protein